MYKDYYQILEIQKSATPIQIHDAYVRALTIIGKMKVAQLSEGKFAHVDLQAVLDEVTEAHTVLSEIHKRQILDENLNVTPAQQNLYYLQKGPSKVGPLTLEQLTKETISEDDLIWRSDKDTWRKAKEFNELQSSLVPTPPLFPKELKKQKGEALFFSKILRKLCAYYFVITVILTGISSWIAIDSFERSAGRYVSDYYDNETAYADRQLFITRPFYAFYSNIYLQKEERKNYFLLVFNLLKTSAVFLLIVFLIIAIAVYINLTI